MLRIAYCGYDYYANCLATLLERNDVQVLKIYACGEGENRRYSNKVIRLAKEHKIPYQFKPIGQKEVERLFDKQSCDYILSAGYSYKIPIGNHKGLNIHPTLLPIGRGAWPFPRIILDGYKESGVTIHKLTDQFDAGDIVLQRSFPIDDQETQDTLHCKNQMIGVELFKEWLERPEELWEKAMPQGEGKYWEKADITDRTLDFSETPEMIDIKVRAYGSKGVLFSNGQKKWITNMVFFQPQQHNYPIGKVIYQNMNFMVVPIHNGMLYMVAKELRNNSGTSRIKRSLSGILKTIRTHIIIIGGLFNE